jgi:hypothetical protein
MIFLRPSTDPTIAFRQPDNRMPQATTARIEDIPA